MRKAIRSSLGRMKWLKYVTPLILPKIVCRQGFMLLFLSNGNSNEAGVFSPFLQKCQRSSIYGDFRTFYILQVLDIADFLEKYFPLSSYMFSYLSKSFNRSKSRRTLIALRGFKSHLLRQQKTHFCLPTKVRFLNDACLRQMMLGFAQ